MTSPHLTPADGEHTFSKTRRSARSTFPLHTYDNGDVLLVQIHTMHSANRKSYFTTIGNVRRQAPDGSGFTAEVSFPMSNKQVAEVDAGARYSEKNLKAAHQAALKAVATSEDPAILRFLSTDQPELAAA